MTESLALRNGVVWICRSAGAPRISPFDLGGRRIGPGFPVAGVGDRPADLRGLAVDEDRRLWVADAGSGSVRAFTAFGAESCVVASQDRTDSDREGSFGDLAGIAAQGIESDLRLLVSRRGTKRHALFIVDPGNGSSRSLRPRGDPSGTFENLAGVALAGRMAFACEAGRGAVQVFRDGEFHYPIVWRPGGDERTRFEPRAVAATRDGRSIVAGRIAEQGALLLFDAGGSFVRRLDLELARGEDALDGDVSSVAAEDDGSESGSLVLSLDRGGSRVLAFTLVGRSLGSFHDLAADSDRSLVRDRAAGRGRDRY